MLSKAQLESQPPEKGSRSGQTEGAVLIEPVNLWPNRQIVYTIDPSVPNKDLVIDALGYWFNHTNVSHTGRTNEADYVTFTAGPGCASSLGRVGGQQFITLNSGATLGNVLHELGHTVGLLHEHTRTDRNNHIQIHWNNIQPGKADYFTPYLFQGYTGYDHQSFDFNSRMMFGARAYAFNPTKPTITKKDGSLYAINTTALSAGDIASVNVMYPAPFEPFSGKARDIASSSSGLRYIIGTQPVNVPFFKGYEVFKWGDSGWTKLPIAAVDIDVDANNQPWIVNALHEIWRFNGTGWQKVPGTARGIGAGAAGAVHIVSTIGVQGGYAIQRWTGTQWETIPGRGGVAIDVDPLGKPWMVDAGKNLYYLTSQWEQKSHHTTSVGVGSEGSVFVLDDEADASGNYGVRKWMGSGRHFLPMPGRGVKITVSRVGLPWVVKADHDIYRQGVITTNY